MTMCSNCGVYEAQPDGLCVKCQSITNNEIMAFSIARQATDDLARLQTENARLRSEVEQRTAVIYGEGYSEGYSDGEKDMQAENKRLRDALEAIDSKAARLQSDVTDMPIKTDDKDSILDDLDGVILAARKALKGGE